MTEKLGKRWRLLDSVVNVRPLDISAAELFSSVCRSEKELLVVNRRYCVQSIAAFVSQHAKLVQLEGIVPTFIILRRTFRMQTFVEFVISVSMP